MSSPADRNLVWVDLEMSGLDPSKEHIIEIATIVTTSELEIVAEGPNIAVWQPPEILSAMDDWCTRTHTASGLVGRVQSSRVGIAEAESQTLDFLRQHVTPGSSPLCGNSIAHDRRFLRRYMPGIDRFLHYRMIDVSSIKELVRRWYGDAARPPRKAGHHLALDDIRESIEELRWYREHVFAAAPRA